MLLGDDILKGIRQRASEYDAENRFFAKDLEQLKEAGYLLPRSLSELVADQSRLAQYAPATALGLGMHFTWLGVAQSLEARGDSSLRFVLDQAREGELFAFAVSERGNDLVLTDSLTAVTRVDNGYRFEGEKVFTSLSPAWTRLGVLGRMGQDIVHGFITRDSSGYEIVEDWDTLGMRATQSHTTLLRGAVVRNEHLARIVPAGSSSDPFIEAIFQNFLLLVSAVYVGIAQRALQLAVDAVGKRTSMARAGAKYSSDPDIRWQIADMAMTVDGLDAPLHNLARDVDAGVDHGANWFRLLSGVKHRSVEAARSVVDRSLRLHGGRGYRRDQEISRLQRDVLAGVYHPSDTEAVHHTVARVILGPLEEEAGSGKSVSG